MSNKRHSEKNDVHQRNIVESELPTVQDSYFKVEFTANWIGNKTETEIVKNMQGLCSLASIKFHFCCFSGELNLKKMGTPPRFQT